MTTLKGTVKGVAAAALVGLLGLSSLSADDTEVYVGSSSFGQVGGTPTVPSAQPNVLFVVDTSGSMDTGMDTASYDVSISYSGSFNANSVYWSDTGSVVTDPATTNVITAVDFDCDTASNAFANTGYYLDKAVAWDTTAKLWTSLSPTMGATSVECQGDRGVHGSNSAATPAVWAASGPNGPWSASASQELDWSTTSGYSFYSGNYLNWNSLLTKPLTKLSRIAIVQQVVSGLLSSVGNINVGLMRFDSNSRGAEGGMVRHHMEDIATARSQVVTELNGMLAGGGTPLSEMMYEAARYFRGEGLKYGITSTARDANGDDTLTPSVAASRQSGTDTASPDSYISPIEYECQKNFLIFLTDGSPTSDGNADNEIEALPGFAGATGSAFCNGNCMDEAAQYMNVVDQSPLPGTQTVITHTIGFAFGTKSEDLAALALLKETALKGGGSYFAADNTDGLVKAFTSILSEIRAVDSTFTAPTVPVNATNRTQHRSEVYMTLFKPDSRPRWIGNLKKYKLDFSGGGARIIDANSVDAVDAATGLIRDTAQSYWSSLVDGNVVAVGGFSSHLGGDPVSPPVNRNIYTYTDSAAPNNTDLTLSAYQVVLSNKAALQPYLNMLASDVDPTQDELIEWMRGVDVKQEFYPTAPITDEMPRKQIGDPLHSQPTVIEYSSGKVVVFFTTNSGYLHAVDDTTGEELFGFIPQELLGIQRSLYINSGGAAHPYGLDGSIQAWVQGNGTAGGANKAYLYFGMRRGGRNYYAMDVTDPTKPKLKWVIKGGQGDFAELGQTWSDPLIKTIKVAGQETDVLIFAGGYDPNQDANLLPADDTQGRALYIVDAETGQRLWWAGPSASGADLELADMTNSIPSQPYAFDVDGDGTVDRIYIGDTRAQVWRFDIDNVNNTTSTLLVTGGTIAKLGAATEADNRRFYYPPSASLVVKAGVPPYLAIVISSGYRAHPLNNVIQDRIYMIKDKYIYSTPATYTAVTEGGVSPTAPQTQLVDTTANLVGQGSATQLSAAIAAMSQSQGWYIRLVESDGSYVGEKGLSQPLIVSNMAVITTYAPIAKAAGACVPSQGLAYIYYLNLINGTPTTDFDNSGTLTAEDRRKTLTRGGIPPAPSLVITKEGGVKGLVGTEFFDAGDMQATRTYWYEQ